LQYFVFVIVLVVLSRAVIKIPFVRKSELSTQIIIALFITRIAAGLTLGWLAHYFSPLNDYTTLNNEGIFEYKHLIHEPRLFFSDIFYSPYHNAYGGYFDAVGSYWNDLRNNIITKILAFLNLISRGRFNTNVLLLNILPFLGSIAIYQIFINIFPSRKWIVIFGCFLIPTTLLFSSGIHKDLFVFSALCFYSYGVFFSITEKFTWKRFALILVSFFMILLMRNFLAMALIPATLGFVLSNKFKMKPVIVYGIIYMSALTFIIISDLFSLPFQPLRIISDRQAEFLKLPKAHSQIELTNLTTDLKSFSKNFPEAIDHGFLQPHFWEVHHWTGIVASMEWIILFLLPLIWVLLSRKKADTHSHFIWFGFAVAFTMFIMIGYIIPNINSIVRYKSIYLPFIITPIICLVRLDKPQQNILTI
jgi:hypothetical protein